MFGAQDKTNIRQTREQRQQAKLGALSSQYNASANAQAQGEGNMMQGFGMAAGGVANSDYFSAENSAARKLARKNK